MIYMRGQPEDFDGWQAQGCTGWGWDGVLPYFKSCEDQERGANEWHGTGGPLSVSDLPGPHVLGEAFHAASERLGVPRNADFNGASQLGTGYVQTTTRNGRRWSTARGYLRGRAMENITIRLHAHCDRVVFEGRRVTGVTWTDRSGRHTARAGREVILCGAKCCTSPHEAVMASPGTPRAEHRLGGLSIARKQMVEIARIHAFNANVVILDEPTASLTDAERDQLFATIRGLKARGVGIIYISHKMDEIFTITDRITVLRDGVVQGTLATAGTDADRVTQMMIGRKLEAFFTRAPEHFGDEVLRVKGLTRQREFHDLSLSVRQGEVLGLYGLIGAGRSEVVETLFDIRRAEAGKLWWLGQECAFPTPRQAIDMGLCLAPENRKEQGLVLGLGGRDNIALPSLGLFSRLGVMRRAREQATYVTWRDTLRIKVSGPGTLLRTLSGGNQQKFVLAKWLCRKPKLLILDEPTRGIDVGSKAAIHQLIAALAGQGLAVIVISSEMPEVLGVSHRILTMADGRLTGEFAGSAMTEQNLIRAVSHHAA